MIDFIKKGSFDIIWFVEPFEEKFGKITDLPENDKQVIISLYNTYYLNYKKFIENIKIYFGDTRTVEYLRNENKCLSCKKNYPILDYLLVDIYCNNNDITFELCEECINHFKYLKCKCETQYMSSKILLTNDYKKKINCNYCFN